jgi:hypothetical protein
MLLEQKVQRTLDNIFSQKLFISQKYETTYENIIFFLPRGGVER